MTKSENFFKGFIKENPLFVSVLGMCPSLAVTTSLENALGMGLGVFFVLTLSNFIISLIMSNGKLAELVKPVRIPVYIVIIATLVTIVEMVMHAFLPNIYTSLGVFIPLIVVNCIILGRAEAFAADNKPVDSILDGMGMALGFTMALSIIAIFREVLGAGTITVWGDIVIRFALDGGVETLSHGANTFIGIHSIINTTASESAFVGIDLFSWIGIEPIGMFVKPAGAFLSFGLILAAITAIQNNAKMKKVAKGDAK